MLTTTDRLEAELDLARLRRRLPTPRMRRLLRERAGITQLALSASIGVEPATISRWESGDREPDDDYLASYLAILDRLGREAI